MIIIIISSNQNIILPTYKEFWSYNLETKRFSFKAFYLKQLNLPSSVKAKIYEKIYIRYFDRTQL